MPATCDPIAGGRAPVGLWANACCHPSASGVSAIRQATKSNDLGIGHGPVRRGACKTTCLLAAPQSVTNVPIQPNHKLSSTVEATRCSGTVVEPWGDQPTSLSIYLAVIGVVVFLAARDRRQSEKAS